MLLYLSIGLFSIVYTHNRSFFNIFPSDCYIIISFVPDDNYSFLKFLAYFQYQYFLCEIFIFFAYRLEEDYKRVLFIICRECFKHLDC